MRRKHYHRGRRLVFKLGLAGVTVAVLWVAGLFQFSSLVPKQVLDSSTRTNAIVVLTGGSRRLGEGLELLSQGLAEKLFVSGVYRGVDVHKLLQIVMRNPRELETRIGIGNATNTAENALETMVWMRAREYRSLRLVTAAYHMPRSRHPGAASGVSRKRQTGPLVGVAGYGQPDSKRIQQIPFRLVALLGRADFR